MMFKQFLEMGLEPVEAMRLERAVERFSAAEKVENKPAAKKTTKKVEVESEDEGFNPIIGIAFILCMVGAVYALYFTLPAWMVI